MEPKELLRQLWEIQAKQTKNGDACRFQLQAEGAAMEYLVCSKAVMLDYAPAEKLEPGKLYKIADLPLKKLQDFSRVNPEIMLCEESLTIHKEEDLDAYFLPLNNWKETGMGVFDAIGENVVLKSVLPYLKGGSFQFAGLTLHHVPDQVRWEIRKNGKFTTLNPRIGKMRSGPVLVLLLSCDSALLVVTLTKNTNKSPLNEHIYMDKERTELYRLDGLREDGVFYTRLVKGKTDLKGLANPTKRKAEEAVQTAPAPAPAAVPAPEPAGSPGDSVTVEELKQAKQEAMPEAHGASQVTAIGAAQVAEGLAKERQVEEIQPEQAEEISEAAAEAPAEASKKRTRAPKKPVQKDYSSTAIKSIDDLIAYLSSPVPDQMTVEAMQEESRKLRDIGVALSRRQSNLLIAATASEKKLRDVLRGVLGK